MEHKDPSKEEKALELKGLFMIRWCLVLSSPYVKKTGAETIDCIGKMG